MKLLIAGPARVKMVPETEHEKQSLDALWKLLIRCEEDSKVLCPIGQYILGQDEEADFAVQDQ